MNCFVDVLVLGLWLYSLELSGLQILNPGVASTFSTCLSIHLLLMQSVGLKEEARTGNKIKYMKELRLKKRRPLKTKRRREMGY